MVVDGKLDDYAAVTFDEQLKGWLDRMLEGEATKLGVDLGGVTFVNSAALRSMLAAARRVRYFGKSLLLLNPSRAVQDAIGITRFAELFAEVGEITDQAPAQFPTKVRSAASDQPSLELMIGDQVISVRDEDSLGLNGTIAPELFRELSGAVDRNLVFRLAGSQWWLEIPAEAPPVVKLDGQLLIGGSRTAMSGDHLLQVAGFRLRLHVLQLDARDTEDDLNQQFTAAFSRAAAWVDRAVLRGPKDR